MRDFRGPLPLTDADFARIRANVIERVRTRRSTFAFRWAFAMLAAAFVGLLSYKSLTPVSTPPPLRPALRSEAPLPSSPPLETRVATPPPRAHRVTRSPLPVLHSNPEEPIPEPTFRMEIQTSDPDIRIIWLPNDYDPKSEETS